MFSEYYFDKTAADKILDFIHSHIRHVEGDLGGQLVHLEEWQIERIINPVFGWKDKATGRRRYQTVYLKVPRKNGKSFLCSVLATVMLVLGEEKGAQIISAASDAGQAGIVFNIAKKIIQQDPELSELIDTYQYSLLNGFSSYKPISSTSSSKHGLNPSCAIIDEIHTFKKRDLYDVIVSGMGARSSPLKFIITTAGDGSSDIYAEIDDYAHKVMDGVLIDETFLPVIYEAASDCDIYNEKVWAAANPNYNISVRAEFLRSEALKARQSTAYENTFKRLYLNITTNSRDGYISDIDWKQSGQPFDYKDLIGKKCWGGMDLSSTSDFSCFTLIFPELPKIYVRTWYWLPLEKGRNSADKNNSLYSGWVREGWVEETEGNVIDYDIILQKILYLNGIYKISKVAYDPHNAASVVSGLYGNGMTAEPYKQWAKDLNLPTKELFRQVQLKNLQHNEDPVLRWSVSNAEIWKDTNDNWKVMKDKRFPEKKVDPVVSLIMALGQWIADENPYGIVEKSFYSSGKTLVGI